MARAYYNEIDPYAAQWLRNLIAAGHIAPGDVDERDIRDVCPDELRGYTQCHFFAGIGVWSYALRCAGWPDDAPVWTGSCPCQPFSVAGMGRGFDDERHLWPFWFHLIEQCGPAVVLGEQVASKDADAWIDLVQDDMESLGAAFGTVPFPASGIGAPNVRDRVYWVAHAHMAGQRALSQERRQQAGSAESPGSVGAPGGAGGVGDAYGIRAWWDGRSVCRPIDSGDRQLVADDACASGANGGLAYTHRDGRQQGSSTPEATGHRDTAWADGRVDRLERSGPTNGFWRAADWLLCRDGKWRPVEPGTFPLAHGAPARVGRLRAYGNAINAEAACEFIQMVMESI
jgi:DNA (cytosine-5)-methyltransferase 1